MSSSGLCKRDHRNSIICETPEHAGCLPWQANPSDNKTQVRKNSKISKAVNAEHSQSDPFRHSRRHNGESATQISRRRYSFRRKRGRATPFCLLKDQARHPQCMERNTPSFLTVRACSACFSVTRTMDHYWLCGGRWRNLFMTQLRGN